MPPAPRPCTASPSSCRNKPAGSVDYTASSPARCAACRAPRPRAPRARRRRSAGALGQRQVGERSGAGATRRPAMAAVSGAAASSCGLLHPCRARRAVSACCRLPPRLLPITSQRPAHRAARAQDGLGVSGDLACGSGSMGVWPGVRRGLLAAAGCPGAVLGPRSMEHNTSERVVGKLLPALLAGPACSDPCAARQPSATSAPAARATSSGVRTAMASRQCSCPARSSSAGGGRECWAGRREEAG